VKRLRGLRRMPSPSMCVALLALFIAIGGVSWAATSLPAGSVGSTQLRGGAVTTPKLAAKAVTAPKLAPGSVTAAAIRQAAVGAGQVDSGTVQRRLRRACPPTAAMAYVSRTGGVACNWSLPREAGAASDQVTVGSTPTQITKLTVPAGSGYLAIANPDVVVNGTVPGQQVTVTCKLSLGTQTATRAASVEVGPQQRRLETGLALAVADQHAARGGDPAALSCQQTAGAGATPQVGVTSAISVIQTRTG
jgi:hypothetical protein